MRLPRKAIHSCEEKSGRRKEKVTVRISAKYIYNLSVINKM